MRGNSLKGLKIACLSIWPVGWMVRRLILSADEIFHLSFLEQKYQFEKYADRRIFSFL